MKSFLSILFLLCCSCKALFGQYGIQTSLVIPTGYYSYLLKPAPSFELFWKTGDADNRYSFGLSIGYCGLNPTQDTFKTYSVGTQLSPQSEVIHSYDIYSIGLTNDLRVLPDSKLCPVIGLDVYFYVIEIAQDVYTEGISTYSTTGDDYWLLSILPRLGLQYKISNKFYLLGGLGRSMSLTGSTIQQAFWKPFITISYYAK